MIILGVTLLHVGVEAVIGCPTPILVPQDVLVDGIREAKLTAFKLAKRRDLAGCRK